MVVREASSDVLIVSDAARGQEVCSGLFSIRHPRPGDQAEVDQADPTKGSPGHIAESNRRPLCEIKYVATKLNR